MRKKSAVKNKKRIVRSNFGGSDAILFNTILIMLCFGLIMCFSASAPSAEVYQNDSYYFLRKQVMWAAIGLVAMAITSNMPFDFIKKYTGKAYIGTLLLLLVVFAMPATKGARRWIYLGPVSFQPSEIAKIVIVLMLAKKLEKQEWKKKKFMEGIKDLLPYALIIGVLCLPIILEPHYSCTIIILVVSASMLILSGADLKYFVAAGLPVACLLIILVTSGYRADRIQAFLHPLEDTQGIAWQTIQSLYAIGSGGLFGLGLGRSRQKFLYLPEAQNDFIFAVICEELGFFGAILVILLYAVLIWRCAVIALNAPDRYSCLVVLGITVLIAFQFIINIAVVTNLVPVTGMPLPFFSAGGSSLVFVMAATGLVLNVSKSSGMSKRK